MAKTPEQIKEVETPEQADKWIARLGDVLRLFAKMGAEERSAALSFLKSKYRADWPGDPYG